ncbi:methyltransferase [Actinocatenispora thailandica]|uniref:Methyltransferase n=1 Tax=Actinocatenispora thailandica TaxID=227318 RepID=A0A7R7HYF8_9ACTN|nr:class I SAM-dependent methyltransferase [Actinocatenispora thailandica]BCJ36591.1 methyltransferase [Actinocatenispora thailandica]
MGDWLARTRASYDADAPRYAEVVRDILGGRLPHLNAALDVFVGQVRAAGDGPVADVGCGPGHVTAHLHDLGIDAFGIDLSPGMVGLARSDHPGLRFEVGSMTDLPLAADSVAGLLAWWSLIHVPDDTVPAVLGQFRRVLRPGGPLQVGFHVGDSTRSAPDDGGDAPVHRRRPERVAGWLRDAGFAVQARWEFNIDTDRPGAILFARG